MTVASQTSFVRYTGDGVTVAFSITFPFQEATDIRLFVNNVLTTSGFTVTGGVPNGTLTFGVAPVNGADIFIRRLVPILQDKTYPTNDTFPSVTHEAALDKLTYIAQQLQRNQVLSLSFPESLNITAGTLPEPEDDAILAWDGATGAVKNGPTTAAFTAGTATAVAAAATATTQAGISTTQAGLAATAKTAAELAETNADASADLAESWAIDPIGDRPEGSAKHWAEQASAIVNLEGAVVFAGTSAGPSSLALSEDTDNGTNTVTLIAPASIDSNRTLTLPDASGTVALTNADVADFGSGAATDGQVLTADGAGGAAFETLATPASGWVPLQTQTVSSAVASVDFTSGIDGTYKAYAVFYTDIIPATDDADLWVRGSTNGGSSYLSSGYNYGGFSTRTNDGTLNGVGSGGQSHIEVLTDCGDGSQEASNGYLIIMNPSGSTNSKQLAFFGQSNNAASANSLIYNGGGQIQTASPVNAIRFLMDTGNIASGAFTLYGLAGA